MLFKKSAPLRIGDVNANAAPVSLTVVSASEVEGKPQPGNYAAELEHLPKRRDLLVTGDRRSVMTIPPSLQYSVTAIEVGPKRAVILFDPAEKRADLADVLRDLRTKLVVDNYIVEKPDRPCAPTVIRRLLDDHRHRTAADSDDSAAASSKNRDLWEKVVDLAVQARATDIHFQIIHGRGQVLIRVDGELIPLPDGGNGTYMASELEKAFGWGYTNAIQSDSNNVPSYTDKFNMYAMIKPRAISGKQISLRYQSIIGAYGAKVVCRTLNTDPDAPTLSFEQLGYSKSHERIWLETSRTPAGAIIIAGTTGSGKTTALKTFIESHPGNGSQAFYSVENPIEYPLKNVHQVPTQIDLFDKASGQRKYAEVAASLMRADPDGVLIGEVRDAASSAFMQQIIQTGHFAAATLHAHHISGIVPRLTDEEIGLNRQVLTNPNSLTLLAYQALVPILCDCKINGDDKSELPHIRGGTAFSEQESEVERNQRDVAEHVEYVLHNLEKRFDLPRSLFNFKRKGGCPKCSGRGSNGLTVVAEMCMPDEPWLVHVRNGDDFAALAHYRSFSDGDISSNDMNGKLVFEHALSKAMGGYVDPRECERFGSMRRFTVKSNKMRGRKHFGGFRTGLTKGK